MLRFEQDLRAEEDFWGWEIDGKYIADAAASFEKEAAQRFYRNLSNAQIRDEGI